MLKTQRLNCKCKRIGVMNLLVELMSESLIQLDVEANSPEEAIRLAAMPLVLEGMIEERYVDGIINALYEFGPYFVLLPHVALPHTRSEEGAIKNAIGITTLKNPVKFGNESNDPVKYVFTLSAVENGSHLAALASLAELFEDEEFFRILDNAKSSSEIMKYIQKQRKEEK